MAKVIVALTMSLDGFIAGSNDGGAQPLGDGGSRLFDRPGSGNVRLETVRVVDAPGVTHLRYRVG